MSNSLSMFISKFNCVFPSNWEMSEGREWEKGNRKVKKSVQYSNSMNNFPSFVKVSIEMRNFDIYFIIKWKWY